MKYDHHLIITFIEEILSGVKYQVEKYMIHTQIQL